MPIKFSDADVQIESDYLKYECIYVITSNLLLYKKTKSKKL